MTYVPVYRLSLIRDGSAKVQDTLGDSPLRIAELLTTMLSDSDREQLVAVYLSASNLVIGVNVVSVGTLTASLVHPREVFKGAILANAAGVVVAHNHPSGDLRPSPEDRETTRRLAAAGRILGIPLLDHVILAAPKEAGGTMRYYSFREVGLLR